MSKLLDFADKLHSGQLSAATHVQRVTLKALRAPSRIAGKVPAQHLADRVPDAPEVLVRPLRKVSGPVGAFVGSREEIAFHASRSAREWAELQLAFQAQIYDAVMGKTPAASKGSESPVESPVEGVVVESAESTVSAKGEAPVVKIARKRVSSTQP